MCIIIKFSTQQRNDETNNLKIINLRVFWSVYVVQSVCAGVCVCVSRVFSRIFRQARS